ncbi:hypothetical protein AB0I82_32315, partial [Streptomyces sp. NPDC050315]|uniref:hypothetical protein n=1 Tax=Streptomyces sp. NPDC050315 TaxID=3155039 RepID=UPI00343FA946
MARRLPLRPALPAALLLFLALLAQSGAVVRTADFLDFGAGVLALVALTGTVLWGLAATDRRVLASRHRLLAQAVHRGTGVAGLGFLALHIGVKVARGQTTGRAAVLPFADGARPLLIGLGTLAGYVFLAVAVTGAARTAFTGRAAARWWRALHMATYLAWGAALVHGLRAGRPSSGWVTAGYALCVAAAALALAYRLRTAGHRGGRSGTDADRGTATAGRAVPRAPEGRPAGARQGRRGQRPRPPP